MNISRVAVLGLLLAATPAMAQHYGPRDEGRRFNDGTQVVCRDVQTTREVRDPNRVAGTAGGAVVGGLLGNQIGSGNGRKAATVGGAVLGGLAGRKIQENHQRNTTVIERQCERVRIRR